MVERIEEVKDIEGPNWFREVCKSQGFLVVLEAWHEALISPYKSVLVLMDVKIIGFGHLGWCTLNTIYLDVVFVKSMSIVNKFTRAPKTRSYFTSVCIKLKQKNGRMFNKDAMCFPTCLTWRWLSQYVMYTWRLLLTEKFHTAHAVVFLGISSSTSWCRYAVLKTHKTKVMIMDSSLWFLSKKNSNQEL